MKRGNLTTTLLVILTLFTLSFTITNGFKFSRTVPNNFFGGTIWNKDSTGFVGLLLVLGTGEYADTVTIYKSDTTLHISTNEQIVFDNPDGFHVGGVGPGASFAFIDSMADLVTLALVNKQMGQSLTPAGNGVTLMMATNSGLDGRHMQLGYDFDTMFHGGSIGVGSGDFNLFVGATNSMSLDTFGHVGFGVFNPKVAMEINGTDAIKIPLGTTEERPSTPEEGHIRYNSDSFRVEYYNGTIWDALD